MGDELRRENAQLRRENAQLRAQLNTANQQNVQQQQQAAPPSAAESSNANAGTLSTSSANANAGTVSTSSSANANAGILFASSSSIANAGILSASSFANATAGTLETVTGPEGHIFSVQQRGEGLVGQLIGWDGQIPAQQSWIDAPLAQSEYWDSVFQMALFYNYVMSLPNFSSTAAIPGTASASTFSAAFPGTASASTFSAAFPGTASASTFSATIPGTASASTFSAAIPGTASTSAAAAIVGTMGMAGTVPASSSTASGNVLRRSESFTFPLPMRGNRRFQCTLCKHWVATK